jgi:hypothetical protein
MSCEAYSAGNFYTGGQSGALWGRSGGVVSLILYNWASEGAKYARKRTVVALHHRSETQRSGL